nr:MAG TPA: Putative head tail adaptor [Caudoviricetes sp.]
MQTIDFDKLGTGAAKHQTLSVRVKFPEAFDFPDFDVKTMKKGLREIGQRIAKISRQKVSTKGVSEPGEYPGRTSGTLRRAIRRDVSKSGFSVTVKTKKTRAMNDVFYPAFVFYGHRGPKTRNERDNVGHKTTDGEKVAGPRLNWITDAVEEYGTHRIIANLNELMDTAIIPKLIRFEKGGEHL